MYEQLPQILFGHLLTKNNLKLATQLQSVCKSACKQAQVVMTAHGGSVNPAALLKTALACICAAAAKQSSLTYAKISRRSADQRPHSAYSSKALADIL